MSEESNKNSKDENNVGDGGMLTKKIKLLHISIKNHLYAHKTFTSNSTL